LVSLGRKIRLAARVKKVVPNGIGGNENAFLAMAKNPHISNRIRKRNVFR